MSAAPPTNAATPAPPTAVEKIATVLSGVGTPSSSPPSPDGIPCFDIEPLHAREAVRRLRELCGFDVNTFVTAVDRFPDEPRYEVVWQFLSVRAGTQGGAQSTARVRLRARVKSANPYAASIVDVFPGAAYAERECFDMFGIEFEGHANLKRLLMPEGYGHHPLRKDFPHQGIEPDRLYREWDRRRHARAAAEVSEVPTNAPDVRTPPPPPLEGEGEPHPRRPA